MLHHWTILSASGVLNASQEMRTLGLCNLLGSCAGSMPTCGAFTRSAVSHTSGIQTPFAGIYSGMISFICIAMLFSNKFTNTFKGYFYYRIDDDIRVELFDTILLIHSKTRFISRTY